MLQKPARVCVLMRVLYPPPLFKQHLLNLMLDRSFYFKRVIKDFPARKNNKIEPAYFNMLLLVVDLHERFNLMLTVNQTYIQCRKCCQVTSFKECLFCYTLLFNAGLINRVPCGKKFKYYPTLSGKTLAKKFWLYYDKQSQVILNTPIDLSVKRRGKKPL